jgi:hypothetical protein
MLLLFLGLGTALVLIACMVVAGGAFDTPEHRPKPSKTLTRIEDETHVFESEEPFSLHEGLTALQEKGVRKHPKSRSSRARSGRLSKP